MAVSLKHTFQSEKGDTPDATLIQPSYWNGEHVLTCAANSVLGREGTSGAAVEIPTTEFGRSIMAAANAAAALVLIGSGVPAGIISMWSGAIAAIPAGWLLCDGTNSTPDLRDRFVIGARQDGAGAAKTNVTGALTTTGGSKDAIVVAHDHTASSNTTGAHTHSYVEPTNGQHPTGSGSFEQRNSTTGSTGSAGAHSHGVTVESAGSSGTNANLVPYYALAFIMKA